MRNVRDGGMPGLYALCGHGDGSRISHLGREWGPGGRCRIARPTGLVECFVYAQCDVREP